MNAAEMMGLPPTQEELNRLAGRQASARKRYAENDKRLIRESKVIEWALRLAAQAEAPGEIDRLRAGYRDIMTAAKEGRVCDDIAWFDDITTLHDFCDTMLSGDRVLKAEPSAAQPPADGVREAIKPFVEFASSPSFNLLPDAFVLTQGSGMGLRQITAGDFRALLAALGLESKR